MAYLGQKNTKFSKITRSLSYRKSVGFLCKGSIGKSVSTSIYEIPDVTHIPSKSSAVHKLPIWEYIIPSTKWSIIGKSYTGYILGTLEVEGVLQPYHLVSLYYKDTRFLIASTYTNVNGVFRFDGVNQLSDKYFIMASHSSFNAVTMDNITPYGFIPQGPQENLTPSQEPVVVYPPEFTTTYIKGTSEHGVSYLRTAAFDPATAVIGASEYASWISSSISLPQKINVDYGVAVVPKILLMHNYHHSGGYTYRGIKTLNIYGSNNVADFNNVTGSDISGLTLLCTLSPAIHPSTDTSDPQEFTIGSTNSYRYIIFQITDIFTLTDYSAVRKMILKALP